MEYYLLLCRSVTYAQRTAQLLQQKGIRSSLQRAPREVSGRGCAYAVRVAATALEPALQTLQEAGFPPLRVYGQQSGAYWEVALP